MGGAAKVEAWADENGAVRVRPKYPNRTKPGLTLWRAAKEYDTNSEADDDDYEEDDE